MSDIYIYKYIYIQIGKPSYKIYQIKVYLLSMKYLVIIIKINKTKEHICQDSINMSLLEELHPRTYWTLL